MEKIMTINNKYEIGDLVYLITDPDQFQGIVTAIKVEANGFLMYEVSCGAASCFANDFELSKEKNFIIDIKNEM